MSPNNEVAIFIDFENIRYGFLNQFNVEPDLQKLMAVGRKYGLVTFANAYSNFNEHPADYRRRLDIAGIQIREVPIGSSDMAMLTEIFVFLLDRANVSTIILMTGDSDFIRVVPLIRNRFGKQVVVCGVETRMSRDLIEAADKAEVLTKEAGGGPRLDVPLPKVEPKESKLVYVARPTDAPPRPDDYFVPSTGSPALEKHQIPGLSANSNIKVVAVPRKPDKVVEEVYLPVIQELNRTRRYMTFGFLKQHMTSDEHGLWLDGEVANRFLCSLKERGMIYEAWGPAPGRSEDMRFLRLETKHPDWIQA